MKTYEVTCYASHEGSPHANSSITMRVKVVADRESEARMKAIDACYKTGRAIEHVKPHGLVREVSS